MKIAIIDPFYEVSHAHWAEGIIKHSAHEINVFSNKPKHWKWQMIGGTLELAGRIKPVINSFDLLVITDMLDLPSFIGYLSKEPLPPTNLYFHENQITYPWSDTDEDIREKRDHHYGFMNMRSAFVADYIAFNSSYHLNSFYGGLPDFKRQFPSIKWPFSISELRKKSTVLPIGINSRETDEKVQAETPVFVWNHRWEYDKGPDLFFDTLIKLDHLGVDFKLIVLGKPYPQQPTIFAKAKSKLTHKIIHWGYAESKILYYEKLNMANISLVTGNQDFFGISVVEAIQHGCYPILPHRLSYPEHLPEGSQDRALYNKDELIQHVLEVLQNKEYLDSSIYQEYISKYNWDKIIPSYDSLFEKAALLGSNVKKG